MLTFLQPPRRRRAFFMLTPLVDVMFLLLIFFMLSSQTSLYTLVRISARAVAGDTTPAPVAPGRTAELLVSIGHGTVRINGVPAAPGDLPAMLRDYQSRGVVRAALVAGQAAQVQDIVSVLELFEAASFGQVRLVSGRGQP